MVTRAYSWCLAALLFGGVVVHISYWPPSIGRKRLAIASRPYVLIVGGGVAGNVPARR
jgi:hypothetical protein